MKTIERHRPSQQKAIRRDGGALSAAGVAIVAAAVLGLTPSMSVGAQLLADVTSPHSYYLRGTNIGGGPSDLDYRNWTDHVLTWTLGAHGGPTQVQYPAGFWPLSNGYLGDTKFGSSVGAGLVALSAAIAAGGDNGKPTIIHGFSQGAVVVTEYMRAHPGSGNTYVLIGNPNRPNGGFLERFDGFYIPILDVSFNGATPTDSDTTIDIAQRYDGWADFPKYPLNLVATVNALFGIAFVHALADQLITAEALAGAEKSTHGRTTYYLLETERLPLLMPLEGIVPDAILDALDPPLRAFIETAYDRSDYGKPTTAALFPGPLSAATAPEPDTAAEPATLTDQPESAAASTTENHHSATADTARRASTPGRQVAAPQRRAATPTSVSAERSEPTRLVREDKRSEPVEPDQQDEPAEMSGADADAEPDQPDAEPGEVSDADTDTDAEADKESDPAPRDSPADAAAAS